MGIETLVIAGLAIAVIGAGVSAYGQYQQGQQQKVIADFNANQQERQARISMLSMQTQAAQQRQQAEENFKLRSAEAQARLNNAKAIENQALTQDQINRENLAKRREDFSRMQGTQRAAIAASGVSESSGTPLDLLAETAAKIQIDAEEQAYAGEVQRRTLFSEAATERLGGKLALAGATLNKDSQVAEAALRDSGAKAEYLAGMRTSEITRLTGSAAARNATYSAGATLLSGVGNAVSGSATYKRS